MFGEDVQKIQVEKEPMKKIRERLERQKTILSRRLKKDPVKTQRRLHQLTLPRRLNLKLHQTLVFARADQQLKDVANAIERMDDGAYGQCIVCGENIEPHRLEALPTATRCWKCQQEKL
jgi:RNA polymerase-binding transcription factor DksA